MFVLDTNVVSELRKVRLGRANANVAKWADSVNAADLYLSVITLQELEIGVLQAEHRDPKQGAVLRTWLNNHVLPAFEGRILPVDTAVALRDNPTVQEFYLGAAEPTGGRIEPRGRRRRTWG